MPAGRETQRSDAVAIDLAALGIGAEPAHGALHVLDLSRELVPRRQAIAHRGSDIAARGEGAGQGTEILVRAFGPPAAVENYYGWERPGCILGSEEIELQILAAGVAIYHIILLADGMEVRRRRTIRLCRSIRSWSRRRTVVGGTRADRGATNRRHSNSQDQGT